MRALRFLGNAVLWLLAALGVLSVLVWGATQLGYLKPLVVISGSMEPGIMTGDLLVDVPKPADQLEVGQVASIYSDVTGNLVSHRVVGVEPTADGGWSVRMKGDANESEDGGPYLVEDTVWQPVLRVPGGGYVVTTLTRPSVALPLGFTVLCLIGLTLLPSDRSDEPRRGRPDPEEPASAPGSTPDASRSAAGARA